MRKVFAAVAVDGNSTAYDHRGGSLTVLAEGTWGSGTITLQVSPDAGSTWISTGSTLTANGMAQAVNVPAGVKVRLALTGSTTPALDAWINC